MAATITVRETLWRVEAGGAFEATLSEQDGVRVIYHAGSDGKVRSVSALTGAERWVWDSEDNAASMTTPLVTPAGLVVGSSTGSVYLLDPKDGKSVWAINEPYLMMGISSVPVIDGRQLLVVSNAGRLYSFLSPRSAQPTEWPGRVRGN